VPAASPMFSYTWKEQSDQIHRRSGYRSKA
jgi:hypothetical protein